MSIAAAVHAFLAQEVGPGADFSEALVLVPHHHLGQAFRQELARQIGGPLLPPRLSTLPALAEEVPDTARPAPDARLLATLHDLLARMPNLLGEAPLWPLARELADFIGEMEEAGQGQEALAALPRSANLYLSAEAAIADTLWRACRADLPHPARLRGERLTRLALAADRPLYLLGLPRLAGAEAAFLAAWGERQPIIELPMPPAYPERTALLAAAWAPCPPPLRERAQTLAAGQPTSPVATAWQLLQARSLEATATMAAHTVREWVDQGRRRIALIALDRLLARRLRALLERDGLLVQDETGWALPTAAASHVLDRWLGLLGQGMPHSDLLDLLKSPYIRAAADPDRAVAELEQAFRRHGPARDLEGHLALAREHGLSAAREALETLSRARAVLPQGRARLAEWTAALLASLDALGARTALDSDPIGAQILEQLHGLERDSAGHPTPYRLADWRRWLSLHLETGVFTDASVESPIRLTHLAAAHHRDWEAALLLGAGAAHLPGRQRDQMFNDATRSQLGLPGVAEREAEQREALTDLLGRAETAAFVWQCEEAGEEQILSPWLQLLDALHLLAWGQGMVRGTPAGTPTRTPTSPPDSDPIPAAPVRAAPPARLTVSAWQSLVACPYQFHARHLLGLNEPDEITEELEKADYGSRVHALLTAFHGDQPVLADQETEALVADLLTRTRAAFAADEVRDYTALAWRLRWERQIPAYIAWAQSWEAQGYRNTAREAPLSAEVIWTGGVTRLEGRADRIDQRQGEVVVLDYKTQTRSVLRNKAKGQGEDVQLPAYAWLAGAAAAGFVALEEKDKVEVVVWDGDLTEAAAEEAQRLADTFSAMATGVPLPAQGAPKVCQWCEMRGLCRVEHQTHNPTTSGVSQDATPFEEHA